VQTREQGQSTLVVAIEHHFVEVGGRIYSSLSFGYDYWSEYLEVFDEVYVLARVGHCDHVPEDHFMSDGVNVHFIGIPDYIGVRQFLRYLPSLFVAAFRAARLGKCFILRSGNVCTALWLCLKILGKPYSRELQGHIGEALTHFTRNDYPIVGRTIAWLSDYMARRQVLGSYCASYVSQFCRSLYPTKNADREFVFSSIRLTPELIRGPRTVEDFRHQPLRVLSVGRLEMEKGHQFLLDAAATLIAQSVFGWQLQIVGGGRQLEPLREKARSLDLESVVKLMGPVQYGEKLFSYLDWADLFVLPSLTEGMPRSLIEAMARGLPAIGSRVGGIVELLTDSQLVAPAQPAMLAEAIAERIGNFEQLEEESRVNFEKVIEAYELKKIRQTKIAFWNCVLAGAKGI